MSIGVGVIGASGYTGAELLRLLATHPEARLEVAGSRQYLGRPVGELVPGAPDRWGEMRFCAPDDAQFADCQAVFVAAPAGVAAEMAPPLLRAGVRVLDLSPDFRLDDAAEWERWYGTAHPSPELLDEAVYGLAELCGDALTDARLVAVPGCYPTAVLLVVAPLLRSGLIEPPLLADCASGVTGAGRSSRPDLLFAEVVENYRAYGVEGHRHLPEMLLHLRKLTGWSLDGGGLVFVPHLVPMARGLFATVHTAGTSSAEAVRQCWQDTYGDSALIEVAPAGEEIETAQVRGGNRCRLAAHGPTGAGHRLILQAVIDNLGKGAAGQALQCFNCMFGLEKTAGLL